MMEVMILIHMIVQYRWIGNHMVRDYREAENCGAEQVDILYIQIMIIITLWFKMMGVIEF